MLVTEARIRAFAPHAMPGIVAVLVVPGALDKAEITTPLRVQHFMTQIAVETGGLSRLEENLKYSAKRLTEVWPHRFPTIASATPYAYNGHELANKTYGGRLGNHLPDDGWRYRGSGMLQTTGRDNFRACGHEDDPDSLRSPPAALASALQYWTAHGCNAIADRDNVVKLRFVINGGSNGMPDAKVWLAKAKRIFV